MDNADIDCRGKPLATTYLQSAVQTFETLGLPDVFPTGVLFAVCLTATPTPTTVLLRENATCLDPVPRQSQSSFRARNAIMTSLIYSIAISMHRTLSASCSLTFRDPGLPASKYGAGRFLFSVQSNEKLEPGWGPARNYRDESYPGS